MANDSYKFGLKDAKIATWTASETWDTAVDVPAVSVFTASPQTVTAQLEGDDIIADVHAQQTSAQCTFTFGFYSLAVLAVLTGETHNSSNDDYSMKFGDTDYPYFGLAGRIDDTQGGGNDIWFLGKCKITEGFTVEARYGQYVIPSVNALAVRDGSTYEILTIFQYDAATAVTIPPTAIGS
jgi:hypothetical protein